MNTRVRQVAKLTEQFKDGNPFTYVITAELKPKAAEAEVQAA